MWSGSYPPPQQRVAASPVGKGKLWSMSVYVWCKHLSSCNPSILCSACKKENMYLCLLDTQRNTNNSETTPDWLREEENNHIQLPTGFMGLHDRCMSPVNTYSRRTNLADSRLLCNWTDLGNVAQGILKLLPWRLEHWALWRRHKIFPLHRPGNR